MCRSCCIYGLDACSLNVADKRSLDFAQTRLLMKLFNTSSTDIVNECRVMFNIQSVSSLIVCRRQKFLTKFMNTDNSVCSSVLGCARRDLNDLIWVIWLFIFSLVSVSCLSSVFGWFFLRCHWMTNKVVYIMPTFRMRYLKLVVGKSQMYTVKVHDVHDKTRGKARLRQLPYVPMTRGCHGFVAGITGKFVVMELGLKSEHLQSIDQWKKIMQLS